MALNLGRGGMMRWRCRSDGLHWGREVIWGIRAMIYAEGPLRKVMLNKECPSSDVRHAVVYTR